EYLEEDDYDDSDHNQNVESLKDDKENSEIKDEEI
ncbi:hypothetical protein CCACVL1_07260, partial [Corchorus capsularis]